MQMIRLILMLFVVLDLTACVDYYGGQPPAPVYGGPPNSGYDYGRIPDRPPQPPIVETKPLEGLNKRPDLIEIQPNLPEPTDNSTDQSDVSQENPFAEPNSTEDPFAIGEPNTGETTPEMEPPSPGEQEQAAQAETAKPIAPTLPEIPKEPETLQPLETFAPQSAAIGSLVMAANEDSQHGSLDAAVASIERAIRIEPRNAALYYKLAVLRLKQSKPRLAEDLAHKAAILAASDNNLKRHSWLLIANARSQQNNAAGAKKAKEEAAKY